MTFDTIVMVDWSGGNDRGATPKKDAIWTCIAGQQPIYHRNRQVAETYLHETLETERSAGRSTLVGFDLCFGYPDGFAKALTGSDDPLSLWDWFEERVKDSPTSNNRFQLAGQINASFPGVGPFWFNALKDDIPNLPRKGSDRTDHGLPEYRSTDEGAFSPWQLAGAGAVGGQVFMGFPTLSRLRRTFGQDLAVWPFEDPDKPIVLAETYFSLLPELPLSAHPIKDAAQVQEYAELFASLSADDWNAILERPKPPSGWVLGRGQERRLNAPAPPKLANDCFALPPGVFWTPVDDALAHLREKLMCCVGVQTVPVAQASGRILAQAPVVQRSHPPTPNSAVDGYGFAGPLKDGPQSLTLVEGRAAAGAPFGGTVGTGETVRILTGAPIPAGVDTVILQEDVELQDGKVHLSGPLKQGANTRKAGEDMRAGENILSPGHQMRASDVGTLIAAGIATVAVRARLRVGVLSTGDELQNPDQTATDAQIFDANRPMILDVIRGWGMDAIDLGQAPDDRARLATQLSDAANRCDVIITSGGASGGDEDHMSALLQDTGSFALWRIAVKPGRPLAFGMWEETPVIALPGNPVAAFLCTLIFARPALLTLAGAEWSKPASFLVPAAFSKTKKAGRREFLRARVENGKAERFASEGSGRISGLSWANGLIELPDEAMEVREGGLVKFIPYSSFGV